MQHMDLNGTWELHYFPQNRHNITTPQELDNALQVGDENAHWLTTIKAIVPGNVELDMQREGKLPDPFFGDNIHLLKPFETYQWWYRKNFTVPQNTGVKKTTLLFEGVDCLADYWLNGTRIGTSDNMFIEQEFDVTGYVRYGQANTLDVRLRSPLIEVMSKEYSPAMKAHRGSWEQLWVRKAPHSYGWDIMPRALSAGLWRPVRLEFHDEYEISRAYFYTLSVAEDHGSATVGVYYEIKACQGGFGELLLRIKGTCKNSLFEKTERVVFSAGSLEFWIKDPKLWWPNGYGDADLYAVTLELTHHDKVVASTTISMGIRQVELIRTETTDENNQGNFLFKINHVPILCKGTNWVPLDAFHSRDASRYERALEMARDLNCNIIRCWGGNVYEDHAFFESCDYSGIMVWQDFAMACARYPQTKEFYERIRAEAVSVIRKLRNHPALILWCGDNECDYGYPFPSRNKITRVVLADAVAKYDPYRPYLPSSPYFSPEVEKRGKNRRLLPEQHLWGPRDYYKSGFYSENTAHFISEIGYHGCPSVRSIKRFIDTDHLWPWQNNDQWITHCTESFGKDGPFAYRIQLMSDQIKELFAVYPDNLSDYSLASQISQAEAKKYFIEMVRLAKWRKTGIIWWNLIDGWPQFSDAVVDYYWTKKLAYHYIKRVQQPVCLMMTEPEDWHVRLVIGNDSRQSVRGGYIVRNADSGETVLRGQYHVGPNQNKELDTINVFRGDRKLFLIEWDADGTRYGNHYLLGPPPFSLDAYKSALGKIAALHPMFEFPDDIGG